MLLPHIFTFNALLCAAAFGFAALVRSGKREALILATLLCVNFVFCGLAYTDYAPKYAFEAIGIEVTSKQLWFCADALFGMACVMAYNRWWGWALWFSSGVQIGIHLAYQAQLFSGEQYSDMLQDVLLAQLAVFFLIGAEGAGNLICDALARLGGVRRTYAEARKRASSEGDQ